MKTEGKRIEWRELVSLGGALILGTVLVVASIGKVLDPVMFVEQIRKEGLEIVFSANSVALIALAIETVLGTALLLGVRTFWVVIPATGLSAFFVFLTGRSFWYVLSGARDNSYDCGCFGVFMQRTAEEAFWQDITLLLVPLALVYFSRQWKSFQLPPARTLVSLLAGVLICIWAVSIEGLPPQLPEIDSQASLARSAAGEGMDAFEPSGLYGLLIDGEEIPDASILESQISLRLAVVSERLVKPVILDIRSSRVYLADPELLRKEAGGGALMPIEAGLEEGGEFTVDNGGLSFSLEGKAFKLISK